jgi:2-haloacid dehalogenase
MSDVSAVKALVFDVFGTVVDWRTSLINDFTKWSETRGVTADWTALVDGWRAVYAASMDEVRKHPEHGYVILDVLHRRSLEKLVEQHGVKGLTDADLHHLTMGWHRLHPWPDSVAGLTRLKTKYIISPLSNGNVALLTNMAKFAGLPWDLIMSAELFQHYKPDPETYLGAAKLPSSLARPNMARCRNTISKPGATGTSWPRILAPSPRRWGADFHLASSFETQRGACHRARIRATRWRCASG